MASVLVLGTVAVIMHLVSISSAQPNQGCKTHCGGIDIPYPFGIGAGCGMEHGFEINCSKTVDGLERPFIGEHELLNIWVSRGKSRALMNIPSYCYNPSTYKMDSIVWEYDSIWPYRFSDVDNMFINIGCNTNAYIYNTDSKARIATGCVSVCGSPEDLKNGSCLGIGCCTSVVPKGLTHYYAYFYNVDYITVANSWTFNKCSYAGLVEKESFVFSSEYVTTSRFNDTYKGRQPFVLDWVIGNVTCEAARRNMSSYACLSENTVCVDSSNGPGYLCNCSSGYQGNPYLYGGCIDINECELSPSPCPESATCQNTVGEYRCSCPFGNKFAKETNSCNNQIKGVVVGISCGIGVLFIALISNLLVQRWKRGAKIEFEKQTS